jgi:formate hydrogenlyase subunit 3/multisubunit Na+/H+ antiporter MnhD subunit
MTSLLFSPAVLLLSAALPALTALLFGWPTTRALGLRLAPWSLVPALVLSVLLSPPLEGDLPWLLMGSRFGLDVPGQVFLFLTSFVWLMSMFYARRYVTGRESKHRFFFFFLLTASGNIGLIYALDMLSYLLFFAVMSLASYGLIVHRENVESLRAGKVYVALVIVGEVLLFSGALLAWSATGEVGLVEVREGLAREQPWLPIMLFFVGFGIKAGAVPFHVWLPLAHPAAPTPASAVLSGTMIKAGLLGWMRFLPVGEVPMIGLGQWCIYAGLFAAFFGVAVGLTQRNPKTILAYSSISQMGYMTLIIGMGMLAPATWPLALTALWVYALHHALVKGALFLGVGVALEPMRTRLQHGLVSVGLVISAAALAGAPWTTGAVAKAVLKQAAYPTPEYFGQWLTWSLAAGAVATTVLMGHFLRWAWPRNFRLDSGPTRGLWVSWAILVVAIPLCPWVLPWPDLAGAARQAASMSTVLTSLWPVLIGVALVLAALKWGRAVNMRSVWRMPAGDLIVPFVWLLARASWSWYHVRRSVQADWERLSEAVLDFTERHQGRFEVFSTVEGELRKGPAAGLLTILLAIVLILVLAMTMVEF